MRPRPAQRRSRASIAIAAIAAAIAWTSIGSDANAQALSASVTLQADRSMLVVGEELTVQVQVQASGGEPETRLPDFRGFDVVGRRQFRPMQMTIGMGGQVIVQSTTVHTYVLRATTPGTFRIGPAVARLGGRDYQSGVVSVIVRSQNAAPPMAPAPPGSPGGITLTPVPPSGMPPFGAPPPAPPTPMPNLPNFPADPTPAPPASPGFPSPPTGSLDGATYDPQGFVRVVSEPARPVVGQQVTVTFYLYSRAQPTSLQVTREPTTEGFWTHDLLPAQRTIDSVRQRVGDTQFYVTVVKRFAAFPLRSGPLTFGAATVHADTRSIFDLWGGGGASGPLERTGIPITIQVDEAPAAGRPDGFEALHVGRYRISSSVDRPSTRTGEAVSYRLDLTGTGNIRNVRIRLPRIAGVRALEPQVRDSVTAQGDAVGGTRHMEWLLIPERPGTYTIPALRVAFYDPIERRYVTLETQAASVVSVGDAAPVTADPNPTTPGDPAAAAPDAQDELRAVRTQSALTRGSRSLAETPWLWLLAAVMPLAWVGTIVASGIRRVTSRVTPEAAQKKALSASRKRLAEADRLAQAGDARGFHAEVARAIKGALEAKLGEQIGGYTLPQLREHLRALGMEADVVHGVVEELESCDFARFSSGAVDASEMDACLGRSARWMDSIARFTPKRDDEPEQATT